MPFRTIRIQSTRRWNLRTECCPVHCAQIRRKFSRGTALNLANYSQYPITYQKTILLKDNVVYTTLQKYLKSIYEIIFLKIISCKVPGEISIDEHVASMQMIVRITILFQVIQSVEYLSAIRSDFFLRQGVTFAIFLIVRVLRRWLKTANISWNILIE